MSFCRNELPGDSNGGTLGGAGGDGLSHFFSVFSSVFICVFYMFNIDLHVFIIMGIADISIVFPFASVKSAKQS